MFNYDPYDILYMGWGMPTWHSQVVLESDVAFDTYCLFNCRYILKAFLSVSPEARKYNLTLRKIVDNIFPKFSFVPYNPVKPNHLPICVKDAGSSLFEKL